MKKADIRAGVAMAYADDWFGEPWTEPQVVVMVHGNAESSRAWTCFVPHLARRAARPSRFRRLAGAHRLRVDRG
ncbi:MAG TPA: hypothetical protein VKX28_03790 [Xanthobacteraceae bacterium]|nr:hypothetical protein [Xanthobacteraceae bacterium]